MAAEVVLVELPVLAAGAPLPVFELEAELPAFPVAAEPEVPVEVAAAPEEEAAAVAARKRSLDWKVWQLEEEGMTGV